MKENGVGRNKMHDLKIRLVVGQSRPRNFLYFVLILIFLVLLSLAACSPAEATSAENEEQAASQSQVLSGADLESQHGLRVSLVAVTAAGGLVDVRIKFVDAEKAKTLLGKPENFPSLWVGEGEVALNVPEETKAQEILFEDNATMFLMYSNAGDVVKPGTPVTVVFGDVRLEPTQAK